MESKKIAVIGAGNMGSALLRGMVKAKWARPANLAASSTNAEKLKALANELGVKALASNAEAAAWADVVVLAVKPQIFRKVLAEIAPVVTTEKLIVSIAAGISTKTIETALAKSVPVVRTMPNLSVTVDLGATAMTRGALASEEHARMTRAIFESVGLVVEVDESLMDAVTGLSGTGPMYIFQIIEGLSDAGVKMGLSRQVANALTIQTVLGAAKMVQVTGQHPGLLKDQVTSPGGTAIAALHSMERGGLRALLIDAVETATKRSAELGQQQNK
ncbi:MAG: pyrroline-5-carboxylate reductase [Thermoplasmatota archaeon]